MERMEKRSYFCERNKGESCSLSSSPSSFFLFYVCIGRGKLNYEVDCGNHNGYTTTGEVEQMILQFATAVHENSSSFECNSACTASIGYFSSTHFTLLALSSCCFPQISVLLEVGNPRKSFYPIRGRLMQMSRNNILAPRLLRKLHWFKTHYPKSRVTNSDNTLLLLVSESKTILTLPLGEETIILWMSLGGIARSSRFAANYWLPLIDPFSTDRTSDTKSKEREIRRSKFETYENLHVHVTSPNRDKRRTALRFVISLPFPREKCNARSLFKEREREIKKRPPSRPNVTTFRM